MAQSCATFGFNPNIVPSPARGSQRATGQGSPASARGSSGSGSLRTRSGSVITTGSSRTTGTWESMLRSRSNGEPIEWDLTKIAELRTVLRAWALMEVPLSRVGQYLERVLFRSDDHMNNLVTDLVENNVQHVVIALEVLRYYQIRDEDQNPLWLPDSQIHGDWNSRSGEASNSFNETNRPRHAQPFHSPSPSVPRSLTPPLPETPSRVARRTASGQTALPRGPSLLMYHHANPSTGRYVDENGNVVLLQPTEWL